MRRPNNQLNWLKRRGVVRSCNRSYVYVVWAGNTGADQLPHSAVERSEKK